MFAHTNKVWCLLDAEGLFMLTSSSKTDVGQVGQSSPTIYLSIRAACDIQVRRIQGQPTEALASRPCSRCA